jgi:hypothetical protein
MRADGSRPNEGRPRIFGSPDELWDAFLKYELWIQSNPILVHDYVGKDGVEVFRQRQRPLTIEGFEVWLMNNGYVTYPDLTKYFDGTHKEFVHVSARIKSTIRQEQVTGGMAGIYNPSLTARINGLVDKVEKTVIQEQPLFSDESK